MDTNKDFFLSFLKNIFSTKSQDITDIVIEI